MPGGDRPFLAFLWSSVAPASGPRRVCRARAHASPCFSAGAGTASRSPDGRCYVARSRVSRSVCQPGTSQKP